MRNEDAAHTRVEQAVDQSGVGVRETRERDQTDHIGSTSHVLQGLDLEGPVFTIEHHPIETKKSTDLDKRWRWNMEKRPDTRNSGGVPALQSIYRSI
jgi:hypothetical protein